MEKYQILESLGKGSYGQALLALDITDVNSKCVLKKLSANHLNEKDLEMARKEVKVLSSLIHEHITEFHDSFEENGFLYIVMEYCSGGDLKNLIVNRNGVPFPEKRILGWFVQLGLAINYIHSKHIIHRDIKTQNVFLTKEGHVKLGDFGIAKKLDQTSDFAQTLTGTPYYLSPEMCEDKPYSFKSDIWAAGCVLYEMACLRHPFDATNIKTLIIKIIKCSFHPLPHVYSRDIKNLVARILQRDPRLRPTMSDILFMPFLSKKLSHYRSNGDFEELLNIPLSYNRMKKKTNSSFSHGPSVRSRIGLSSPASKYETQIIPKRYVCQSSQSSSKKIRIKAKSKDYTKCPNSENFSSKTVLKAVKKRSSSSFRSSNQKFQKFCLAVSSPNSRTLFKHKHSAQKSHNGSLFERKSFSRINKISCQCVKRKQEGPNVDFGVNYIAKGKPECRYLKCRNELTAYGNMKQHKNTPIYGIKKIEDSSHSLSSEHVNKVLYDIKEGKYITNPKGDNKKNTGINKNELESLNNIKFIRSSTYVIERHGSKKDKNNKPLNLCEKDSSTFTIEGHKTTLNYENKVLLANVSNAISPSEHEKSIDLTNVNSQDNEYDSHRKDDTKFSNKIRNHWRLPVTPLFEENYPLEHTDSKMDSTSSDDKVVVYGNRKHWNIKAQNSILNILSSARLNSLSSEVSTTTSSVNSNVQVRIGSHCNSIDGPSQISNVLVFSSNSDGESAGMPSYAVNNVDEGMIDNVFSENELNQESSNCFSKSTVLSFNNGTQVLDTNELSCSTALTKGNKRKLFSFLRRPSQGFSESSFSDSSGTTHSCSGKKKSRFSRLFRKMLKSNAQNTVSLQTSSFPEIKIQSFQKNNEENRASVSSIIYMNKEPFSLSQMPIKEQKALGKILETTSDSGVSSWKTSLFTTYSSCHDMIQGLNTDEDSVFTSSTNLCNNSISISPPDISLVSNNDLTSTIIHVNNIQDEANGICKETDHLVFQNLSDSEIEFTKQEPLGKGKNELKKESQAFVKDIIQRACCRFEKQINLNIVNQNVEYLNCKGAAKEDLLQELPKNYSIPSNICHRSEKPGLDIHLNSSVVVSQDLISKIQNKVLLHDIIYQERKKSSSIFEGKNNDLDTFDGKIDYPSISWQKLFPPNSKKLETSSANSEDDDDLPSLNLSLLFQEQSQDSEPWKQPWAERVNDPLDSITSHDEKAQTSNTETIEILSMCDEENLDVIGSQYISQNNFKYAQTTPVDFASSFLDCDMHGWIEERRAFFEKEIGLDIFLEAYHYFQSATDLTEQSKSDSEGALKFVEQLLGSQNAHMAKGILELFTVESVQYN